MKEENTEFMPRTQRGKNYVRLKQPLQEPEILKTRKMELKRN